MSTWRSSSSISTIAGVLDHRRDLHAGERRLAPVGGVEGRQAHEPVHALLGAEQAVGVLAAGPERGRLDARLLPRAGLEQLDLEAAALGPAHEHAQDHLGPVLGVGAAGAGVDGHEGVARSRSRPENRRSSSRSASCASTASICSVSSSANSGSSAASSFRPSRSSTSACRARNCSSLRRRARVIRRDLGRALLVVPEAGRAHGLLELGRRCRSSPAGSKVVREQRELVADRRKALRRRL